MPEKNVCLDANCPAACCRNIHGHMPSSEEFFLKMFPGAIPLTSGSETVAKIKNQEAGVYYFAERSHIYFSISGDCPNLMQDLGCAKHGKRFYPSFCTNMKSGSIECLDSREIYKLNLA